MRNIPPIPHPETPEEREKREAKEEEEENRTVNMYITDIFDEFIDLEKPSWEAKQRHLRGNLAFLYSIPGGEFNWMMERENSFNAKRRKESVSYTHLTLPTIYSV